jgi:hypothetical protein
MNSLLIKFKFKIEILKKPPKKQLWKIIIVTNRSAVFKPVILESSNLKKNMILIGNIEGFNNYLNLKRDNLYKTYLFFYSFFEDKNKEFQINKFKKYKLIELLKKGKKTIKFKEVVILLKNLKVFNSPTNTLSKKSSSFFSSSPNLKNYRDQIDRKLKKTFYIKDNERWHVIYYSLNEFKNFPVVGSLIIDNEKSNELFWINIYNCVRDIYNGYNLKWDPKVCWVNLFTAINNFAHNYVMENKDIYMESWFLRFFDCDESTMSYILYRLFLKCKFSPNIDLYLIKSNIVKQYIGFTDFWYVRNHSANTVKVKQDNLMGHWTSLFILRCWFFEHWIDKPKNLKFFGNFENSKGLQKFLFGESTAFLYPSINKYKYIPERFSEERKPRFLPKSKFYYRINTLTTTEFLNEYKIGGFYCGRYSPKYNMLRYGIKFKNLFIEENLKRIVFVSFPKLSNELIIYIKKCAEERLPIPKFLSFMSKDKIVHHDSFVTIENMNGKIRNLFQFFKKNFIKEEKDINYNYKHFHVFSLDDLMNKKLRKKLRKKYSNKIISITMYEFFYKTYAFSIKIY